MTARLPCFYDLQLGLERRAVQAALDMLELRAEDRLLDVGTGTGAVLRSPSPLLERHGLSVRRASYVNRGYPSLCVLAEA